RAGSSRRVIRRLGARLRSARFVEDKSGTRIAGETAGEQRRVTAGGGKDLSGRLLDGTDSSAFKGRTATGLSEPGALARRAARRLQSVPSTRHDSDARLQHARGVGLLHQEEQRD